jgi:RNA recognition motif-containing protein
MDSAEGIEDAIKSLNGAELMGRQIRIDHAYSRDSAPPREYAAKGAKRSNENTVFIGSLSWNVGEELIKVFKDYDSNLSADRFFVSIGNA